MILKLLSEVVCQLDGYFYYYQHIWGGSQRHSKYYDCMGSERRLAECRNHADELQRSQSGDVVIDCYNGKLIYRMHAAIMFSFMSQDVRLQYSMLAINVLQNNVAV